MVNVVVDDKIPFIRGVLEAYANVSYLPASEITKQRLLNTDALVIRTRTHCNADLLDETAVKFIVSATIGFDHIDTAYCKAKGITWTNAAGCNASSVGQYVLAALLELANRRNLSLQGKIIGIVGVGNVGSKIAQMAETLGLRVLLCDPPRARTETGVSFVTLDELVSVADIVTVHVSLSRQGVDRTYGLFDGSVFSKVKKGSVFINTSRGEVVDEVALKEAIAKQHLADVVLDVWHNEPDVDTELLKMASIATPHVAGYSVDGKAMGTAMSVRALSNFFGWGLGEWFPELLPVPENTHLQADFLKGTVEHNLHQLVSAAYSITSDDSRLRLNPRNFEQQRGDYPLRREFDIYTVKTTNITDENRQMLSRLTFRLE